MDSVYFQQIFDQINSLFKNIKTQLFTEEWICDETKLVFIYKDRNASPQSFFVYDGSDKDGYILKNYDSENTFETLLNEKYGKCQYIYDVVNTLYINNSEFVFYCACVSPCFGNNHGRLLLTKIFWEMLASD